MSTDVRGELVRLMRATIADHAHWTYRAVRPLPVPPTWHRGQHVVADCSHGVKLLCRWAPGCPDPMKSGWSTWGNSTTLAMNLQHLLTPATLQPGDIVTFGLDGNQHAAMVLEQGVDPLLWSFGHQGAPGSYRLSEDGREHQLLRLPVAASDPSKKALRMRTGWFSWTAWRLAEGDWKPYGPKNPEVRPNVPTLIPASWWARLVRFLRAREKGNPATTGGR